MDIIRRDFLFTGLAALVLGGCSFQSNTLVPTPDVSQQTSSSIFTEFSIVYQQEYLPKKLDKTKVTILYPGSGWDLTPIEIGLDLLRRTKVQQVDYIYTEIGDWTHGAFAHAWPEGLTDLEEKIDVELQELVKQGFLSHVTKKIKREGNWIRKDIPSAILEYECTVKIKSGTKTLTLAVGYNTFENRLEPTVEEKRSFSPELLQHARKGYWPKETELGKIYPTYFNLDQFERADIILSKQCGDFPLLQLDYVRAANAATKRKTHVVLTEHIGRLDDVQKSLGTYTTSLYSLSNHNYGYCDLYSRKECSVAMLGIIPK